MESLAFAQNNLRYTLQTPALILYLQSAHGCFYGVPVEKSTLYFHFSASGMLSQVVANNKGNKKL